MPNYIARHKPQWEELERLVRRAQTSIRGMSPGELSRLDLLYRQTTVHLAQVSTRTRDLSLLRYLNDLTASAHAVIYLRPKPSVLTSAWTFVHAGFARAVVRTLRFHAIAGSLFFLGALLAYFAVKHDPSAAYALLPAMESRQPGSTPEQLLESLRSGRNLGSGNKFFFASFLFTHNLKVGLMALATGILAAVPCVILIIYNGMILGAFTAVHHDSGIYGEYWAWILPHGITEIGAIVLCGGIGLSLGRAIVCPGIHSRSESLRRAGVDAAPVIIGVGVMLFFAALIESYLRQSNLPTWARFAFAGGTFIFWAGYFGRGWMLERAEQSHVRDSVQP